jgi:hypothetical protein
MLARDKVKAYSELDGRISKLFLRSLRIRLQLVSPRLTPSWKRWNRVMKAMWLPLKWVVPQSLQSLIVNFLSHTLRVIPSCLILIIRGPLPILMELSFYWKTYIESNHKRSQPLKRIPIPKNKHQAHNHFIKSKNKNNDLLHLKIKLKLVLMVKINQEMNFLIMKESSRRSRPPQSQVGQSW